jgi:hypothetical protein
MVQSGLRSIKGMPAAPPFTKGPYVWDQELSITGTNFSCVDLHMTGNKDGQTLMENDMIIVTATGWTAESYGALRLAPNKTTCKFTIPVTGLKIGDELVSFKIVGAASALSGTSATTIDASLRKVYKTAGSALTDASIADMTQVAFAAASAIYHGSAMAAVTTVAAGYQYYILCTGTTANENPCTASIIGAEVVVNRK